MTETERLDTARRDLLGGLVPLEHLNERLVHDGAQWIHEDAEGKLWGILWSEPRGTVAAHPFPSSRKGRTHRGEAASLEEARKVALRLAGEIDGKAA